jgi:hypothetical protein
MTLLDLQQSLSSQLNKLRAIQRILDKTEFADTYKKASEEDRSIVMALIKSGDSNAVEKWLRSKIQRPIEEMSVRELRHLAMFLCVQDYQLLTKASLLSEIRKRECRSQS